MDSDIRKLEPLALWNHFADLNSVPRPSKKEERVIAFIKSFGESLGLETRVDEAGNVIIRKPASPGMENRETVVLQSHLDMVHQKNSDSDFDFETQGIEMYIDGDWVKARGTTLGADNGIGVAAIMAILSSDEITHPPLEALFTVDEETGMTGAMGLKGGELSGSILLNLDTEDDDELTIGCAGGIDVTSEGSYGVEAVPSGWQAFKVAITGLTGGHSGMDIHLGRANANKLMNRLLYRLMQTMQGRIVSIDGGGLRNAIPRESEAVVVLDGAQSITDFAKSIEAEFRAEYSTTDPDLTVSFGKTELPREMMARKDQDAILAAVYACPVGIYRMSPDISGLVQTSNNLARVLVRNGTYSVQCLTRSSVESEKMDLATAIKLLFELAGGTVTFGGEYPGWTPKPSAPIVQLMTEIYLELFRDEPHVMACHAGLECGILGTNYPDMQMISFGPNIRGAHSPDERVQISSVQKFWSLLLETLKRIPEKG
ncbi:MAG: aminoacyl-histidine dipeptidase [Salibacteraceae bacterium]